MVSISDLLASVVAHIVQGWKGSVKARHFIAALRDYYQEKALNEDEQGLPAGDKWTLDYINPRYAQHIQWAFDDDASGFITVQEVNRFTQLRPHDWRYAIILWNVLEISELEFSMFTVCRIGSRIGPSVCSLNLTILSCLNSA